MDVTITVCIPTIPTRRSLLSRLLWGLQDQQVDVIIADGDRPMGDKLNDCFQAATTTHVVCVDDDDMLPPDFDQVANSGYAFVGYRILWLENGRFAGSVAHHGDGDTTWNTLTRGVSPKCPIATRIARAHKFGNHYTADREWAANVQADLPSHKFIDRHLYTYDHWTDHMVGTEPDTDLYRRPQRDVGRWPVDWSRFRWL